jgi:FKBP-type peptidyl-prolyl cis-trans isomerase
MKETISLVAILALTAACTGADDQQLSKSKDAAPSQTAEQNQQDFKTLEDRFSYASGLEWAERLKAEGIKLNADLMAEAMRAVFDGGKTKMSKEEAAATIGIYREVHEKEKAERREVAAEKNKKEGEPFLKENAKKEGVVVTKSGLQYKVLTHGNGRYKPKEDDNVKIHYRATVIDGTEFDNTYARNKPHVGMPRDLIQGVSEALQLMTEGSKWQLWIPADLAYGEEGSDPWVTPNAVLIFEMELLEIEQPKKP